MIRSKSCKSSVNPLHRRLTDVQYRVGRTANGRVKSRGIDKRLFGQYLRRQELLMDQLHRPLARFIGKLNLLFGGGQHGRLRRAASFPMPLKYNSWCWPWPIIEHAPGPGQAHNSNCFELFVGYLPVGVLSDVFARAGQRQLSISIYSVCSSAPRAQRWREYQPLPPPSAYRVYIYHSC